MAVGQSQWYHSGVGAPPILVSSGGDWDVDWGYGLLTCGHVLQLGGGRVFQERGIGDQTPRLCQGMTAAARQPANISEQDMILEAGEELVTRNFATADGVSFLGCFFPSNPPKNRHLDPQPYLNTRGIANFQGQFEGPDALKNTAPDFASAP